MVEHLGLLPSRPFREIIKVLSKQSIFSLVQQGETRLDQRSCRNGRRHNTPSRLTILRFRRTRIDNELFPMTTENTDNNANYIFTFTRPCPMAKFLNRGLHRSLPMLLCGPQSLDRGIDGGRPKKRPRPIFIRAQRSAVAVRRRRCLQRRLSQLRKVCRDLIDVTTPDMVNRCVTSIYRNIPYESSIRSSQVNLTTTRISRN